MSYMEFKETYVPEKIQQTLENLSAEGKNPTLKDGGFYDWLTELSREGWRPVWPSFNFPFIVLEREVNEEVEN